MSKPIKADFKGLVDEALGRTKGKEIPPTAIDGSLKRIPLAEVINLEGVDTGGDMVPKISNASIGEYTLTKPFMRVGRLIVMHTWTAVGAAYEHFGDGTAPNTLATGLQIYVNEIPLFDEAIVATKDYMKYAYDTDVVIDGVGATKKTYFTSRFTFSKFMGFLEGIDLSRYDMRVEVDITTVGGSSGVEVFGNEFKWTFEGWGWDE